MLKTKRTTALPSHNPPSISIPPPSRVKGYGSWLVAIPASLVVFALALIYQLPRFTLGSLLAMLLLVCGLSLTCYTALRPGRATTPTFVRVLTASATLAPALLVLLTVTGLGSLHSPSVTALLYLYSLAPVCLALLLPCYGLISLEKEYTQKVAEINRSTKRELASILHNTVQPDILALSMRLRLDADQTTDPRAREQMLTTADDLVNLNKEKIKTLTRVFDPFRHEGSSLSEALDLLIKSFPQVRVTRYTPHVTTSFSLPREKAACVYFCVEQALVNVVVHAQSSPTRLTSSVSHGSLHVHVVDRGPGLPPTYREGLGLAAARQATLDVPGARTSLRNNPKAPGTVFTVSVPL